MQMFRVQMPLAPAQPGFKGALIRVCGKTIETREGISVWLDLSLVLQKLTP